MKTRKVNWTYLVTVALLASAGLLPPAARAFDTGHHSDLTRSALQEEGFSDSAIKVSQLENWLVDYYSNTPTEYISPQVRNVVSDMEKLHFDNLYSTAQIRNYWGHLTRNAHTAIGAAARQNDPVRALVLLGATLHAVQDFYTHSNWAEKHPRTGAAYRADTFFDNPPPAGMDLFTGYYPEPKPAAAREAHGDYTVGLNHDSYVRPRWAEAYIFAYVASRQWTEAMRAWSDEANPAFWATVRNYTAAGENATLLDRDINAAYRISEWVGLHGTNGHWKGSGSGSNSDFIPFAAAWIAAPNSIYVEDFSTHRYFAPLLAGLASNNDLRNGLQISEPTGNAPTVPRARFSEHAFVVRTLRVAELPVGFFEIKIDSGGFPDFYGKITIAGQTFVEAMQLNKSTITPSWTSIRFFPFSHLVPITYQMWDDDTIAGVERNDDHCDINPQAGQLDLNFHYNPDSHECIGDVSGVHDSDNNAAVSEGAKPDKDRASVRFYVTTWSIAATPAP